MINYIVVVISINSVYWTPRLWRHQEKILFVRSDDTSFMNEVTRPRYWGNHAKHYTLRSVWRYKGLAQFSDHLILRWWWRASGSPFFLYIAEEGRKIKKKGKGNDLTATRKRRVPFGKVGISVGISLIKWKTRPWKIVESPFQAICPSN